MPPLVIAAGIGAIGAIGGGLLASSAQKKAAQSASNTAASTAAANNALQSQIYQQNASYLSPYAARGNEAGNSINALLGIGTGQTTQQYGPAVPTSTAPAPVSSFTPHPWFNTLTPPFSPPPAPPTAPPATATGSVNSLTPQAAFQNYLNSAGYQFQMNQGAQAINQNYAAKGALQSGAALKALQTYGQNTGASFFDRYLGYLGNQQGVGLSGASAIAGVGQNYANAANANNNSAGSAIANAQLSAGQANANLYGTIGSSIGSIANAFGSSYRPGV